MDLADAGDTKALDSIHAWYKPLHAAYMSKKSAVPVAEVEGVLRKLPLKRQQPAATKPQQPAPPKSEKAAPPKPKET
jgi:hypothetical protein